MAPHDGVEQLGPSAGGSRIALSGGPRPAPARHPQLSEHPTGYTYDVDKLRRLADVARKYRVVLLSDEIYGELQHDGAHRSIAELYPEGTIVSSGLSKWCGAGGWRLGTFTFPENLRWLLDAMASVASETYTATSAPIQYAAVRAFEGGAEIEHYLMHCRRVLSSLGRVCADSLRLAGVGVGEPDGAFYLFPSFQRFESRLRAYGVRTSDDLCHRLLEETGVATIPGSHFGRPESELTLRLAYVDFDGVVRSSKRHGRPPEVFRTSSRVSTASE